MSPDEAEKTASEQPAAPDRGRRRSRRGGRRHPRRREPRASGLPPTETVAAIPDESSPAAIEEAEQREETEGTAAPKTPAITDAIAQVNGIIEELKHALDEMEEVLETLELAERQKIDDEREMQNLQRALRQLRHPREGESRR